MDTLHKSAGGSPLQADRPVRFETSSASPISSDEKTLLDASVDGVAVTAPARGGRVLLGIGLVLIAFNLRPLFSSLSTVLPEVMRSTGLSSSGSGLLTTLPVLCMGLFAPAAPALMRRFGAERTLLGVLMLLALGTALRGVDNVVLMFLATGLAGAAIAVGNVLLPSLVKRDFADKAGLMTGLYTMALCSGAGTAAALTLPLEHLLGGEWRYALMAWAVPVLVVIAIWAVQAWRSGSARARSAFRVEGLLRDGRAWQVTLFMGLQSALAYAVFGWLAPILRARGMDGVSAGLVLSISIAAQAVACLVSPSLALRCRQQSWLAVGFTGLTIAALMVFLFAPLQLAWPTAVALGIGQGGMLACALMMIVLRSGDSHVASQLSTMAQSVGYVLATLGPFPIGLLRTWTGSYSSSAAVFIVLSAAAALAGFGGGRAGHVGARSVAV